MNPPLLLTTLKTVALAFGIKVVSAIVLWFVGRWLISLLLAVLRRVFTAREIDPTITTYILNTLKVALNIFLALAILGRFGVETTSFAALLAGAGLAIGTAWAGMLANFAAGAFMVILRPFKVGDQVSVAGITGTVREIGLFVTAIDTSDNIRTFVGNNKVFGSDILNFHTNAYRRIDLKAQLSGAANLDEAVAALKAAVAEKVPHQTEGKPAVIDVIEITELGPVLCVRPFTHNDHYWEVYFATNRVILETLARFPSPIRTVQMLSPKGESAARLEEGV